MMLHPGLLLKNNSVKGTKNSTKPAAKQGKIVAPCASETIGSADTYSDSSDGVQDSSKSKENSVNKDAPQVFDKMPNSNLQKINEGKWADFTKSYTNVGDGMKLVQVKDEGELIFNYETDYKPIDDPLGFCLVGYFAGRFPGKEAVHKIAKKWNRDYQFIPHQSGWLVFKFKSSEDRDAILKGGPYFIYGRPLLLKEMTRDFNFSDEGLSLVPVWIRAPEFPLFLWTVEGLSKLASRVGKPIATDHFTNTVQQISYARILVEIDAAKDLIKEVEYITGDGQKRLQQIVYETQPKFCTHCKFFGHSTKGCTHKGEGQSSANQAAVIPLKPKPPHVAVSSLPRTNFSAGLPPVSEVIPAATEPKGTVIKPNAAAGQCSASFVQPAPVVFSGTAVDKQCTEPATPSHQKESTELKDQESIPPQSELPFIDVRSTRQKKRDRKKDKNNSGQLRGKASHLSS